MKNKKRNLNEDLTLRLSLPEEIELDPSQVDVSVVGAEEDEMGMGDDEVSLDDLEGGDELSGGDEMDMDMSSPEEEEPVEEMDHMGGMEQDDMYESKDQDIDSILESLNDDDVIEIDEAMLRKELKRMSEDMSAKVLDDFGGATSKGEPFVDTDDDDLNVLGESDKDEVKEDDEKTEMKEGRKIRALQGELAEYRKVVKQLRGQLAEMNLFSAKLLYTNKLLQSKGFTPEQKLKIVESMDKAETLREVKLVYTSLTESLKSKDNENKETKKTSMTETLRRKVGASKPVKPSSSKPEVLNEGNNVQVSRWAQLAGINEE